ncbi:MAG: hypothetical protein EP350_04310 [Alphaproteobacteria bacterium]|nr:MAG: hypothetical protein EP350_04310 [Alphaproteobacteria bacterium]
MSSELPPFVRSSAPGVWVLESAGHLTQELEALGATLSEDGVRLILRHASSDDNTMADIARGLRALGFYFSDGRDWSPKAVLQHLRDQGAFSGPIPVISWTRPENFTLREI